MLNRAQVHVISITVFLMVLPSLYRAEKQNTNTAVQVEQLSKKLDSLEDPIKAAMERPERWQNVKNAISN